jgi:hypothetical protein
MASGNRFDLERDIVIVACAISAGIHAALIPGHFGESPGAGAGFVAATVLVAVASAGAVLSGLLVSYALATTTGLPVLHPEPEPLDGLAAATKAIEALGLAAALHLIGHGRTAAAPGLTHMKGAQ